MTSRVEVVRKGFNWSAFFLRWEWMLVLLLIGASIVNVSLSPYFLNVDNLFDMTFNFMERAIIALLMTFVIIMADIDLSVASNLAMTATLLGILFQSGVNIWVAVLIALVVGALAGMINGLIITRIDLPALAVTLGTYVLYRGIAWVILEDHGVTGYPSSFTYIGQGDIPGTPVPVPLVIFAALAIPFGLILHKTTFGRFVYAIGSNKEACLYSGVKIDRIKLIVFTLSGLLSALAGVMMVARFGSARADVALGAELDVITAVVLGGVDIFGGSGTMPGVVLALFLLGVVRYGMNLANIPPQNQIIVTGLLLIVAIILPYIFRQISARRMASARGIQLRGWELGRIIPYAAAFMVVAIVAAAVLNWMPIEGPGPWATGGVGYTHQTTPEADAPLAPVAINTPVPPPSTPTPRPTRTPTPTLPPTSTAAAGDPTAAAGPTETPAPTEVPRPDVEMVEIPAGPFVMGSDDADPDESPPHDVELPAFYIDKFEVSNSDFEMFANATGYQTDAEKAGKKNWKDYTFGKTNHPVVKASWNDAAAFCEWMGKRLPTEEEWEKAARGDDGRTYPWGSLFDTSRANVKLTGLRGTASVGSFGAGASPYGVEDMSGNVWEWTSSPYLGYPGSTYQDPYYSEKLKVTRGGGWFDDQKQIRCSNRSSTDPIAANDDLGFRCAADSIE